jgi:CO/xanthine dehydrogenase FAD-binding subunit
VQSYYYKAGKCQALAIAVVSLAVFLETGQDNKVKEIKLAWGSVVYRRQVSGNLLLV